jgi:methionyl-tRNA formyltransferase
MILEKLKVIFIGGLTNGKIVLDYLQSNKYVQVPLIITYPIKHTGPRHTIISEIQQDSEVQYNLNASEYLKVIEKIKPDYIFVAGWSALLPDSLIKIPKKGTIGFHPSKLPLDRGRSAVAWQIEEGYKESALTMFYYNEAPDCGDIIGQERFMIEHNDYIGDILNKVDQASYNLIRAYFPLLRKGLAPRKKQDLNEGSFRRLRGKRDSLIDWDQNALVIYNKIRAISKPYPGATGKIDNVNYLIWKSEIIEDTREAKLFLPGSVITLNNEKLIVKCREHSLAIIDYEKR